MIRALVAIWLIWGLNWVVMKTANLYFPPILFVTYRFVSGAAILLVAASVMKTPFPKIQHLPWIIVTGILQIAFNAALVQVGIKTLEIGPAVVLNFSMPLWVAIIAHFALGERLTIHKLFGICLSLVGMCILMSFDGVNDLFAASLVLFGAISWAVAGVLMKLKLKSCNMMQMTTWQMVSGAIALSIYSAIMPQSPVDWNVKSILCLIYNGALASAAAFFLWSYLLMKIEASKASTTVLGVPIVGILGGIIFLNEPMTLHTAIGMILILFGIYIVVQHKSQS